MAPFLNNELFSLDVGLVLSVLIGIGFGFSLERGGFAAPENWLPSSIFTI